MVRCLRCVKGLELAGSRHSSRRSERQRMRIGNHFPDSGPSHVALHEAAPGPTPVLHAGFLNCNIAA